MSLIGRLASSSGSKSELPVDLYDDSIPLETEKFTGSDITKEESKRFSDFNVYKRRYAYLSKLKVSICPLKTRGLFVGKVVLDKGR